MTIQVKDTRLWDKGNKAIPFTTRDQKLASDLMRTLGMKKAIIKSFNEGKILKTNCINPLSIYQQDASKQDKQIISDLAHNGLLVYHILYSYKMIDKVNDIQSEFEVSMFENVALITSYLCAPKDIFGEANLLDEDVVKESNRKSVINNFVEDAILRANQGFLFAYVVNEEHGISDFNDIEVSVMDGNIVKVD
ncbi:hypothetical protein [Bacillus sp. FJAT-45350]|uniref:hypothetical protein n=1 Tax=Bacillus sp. FJAT-45350 TaxID=2011014 RepID=UPI000BB7E839|nr:hypothetical protein [Bacillus sp. FJAT-45350]